MNIYFLKGGLYLLFAALTPLLLGDHLVWVIIQMVMLGTLGVAFIVKGARKNGKT